MKFLVQVILGLLLFVALSSAEDSPPDDIPNPGSDAASESAPAPEPAPSGGRLRPRPKPSANSNSNKISIGKK